MDYAARTRRLPHASAPVRLPQEAAPSAGASPSMSVGGWGGRPMQALALDHVDFTLERGRSLAVMGPSRSGKSTLLHVLAGIVRPTSGSVYFEGTDICRMSDAERTRLRRGAFGFVFQSGQLLPELPAVENIALPLMLGGMDYRHATDAAIVWLERLGLRSLASHRPGEMSGGQMQRIAIARALCVNPSVVFADEPTGALDQKTGHEVMGMLMQTAQANGSSVVVVTHDPHVASFCDQTVVMQDGRLSSPIRAQDPAASSSRAGSGVSGQAGAR